jgi:hypothetical protein
MTKGSRKKTYTQHHHGCTLCHRRYVCACPTPAVAEACNVCVSGRLSASAESWAPHECCLINVRPCRKDELKSYKLAPSDTWVICITCARTFPTQPEQVGTT